MSFLIANMLQPLIDLANTVLVLPARRSASSTGPRSSLLTFITRALILPLSIKQIRSMRALSALSPQIKEVQEKYKDDRQRMQREMMEMYQKNNVNPFASCLPLLLQLPVFISLFYLLQSDEFEQRGRGRRAELLAVHQQHPREGDRRRPDRPARALHRHLGDRRPDHDRPQRVDPAADAVDGPADPVHPDHDRVPRRAARLLDLDQLLDDGPAGRRQALLPARGAADPGRGQGLEAAPAAPAQAQAPASR